MAEDTPVTPPIGEQIVSHQEKLTHTPENLDEIKAIIATEGDLSEEQVQTLRDNLEPYQQHLASLEETSTFIQLEETMQAVMATGETALFLELSSLIQEVNSAISEYQILVSRMEELIPTPEDEPEPEATAGPTRDELIAEAREKLEAQADSMTPEMAELFKLMLDALEKTSSKPKLVVDKKGRIRKAEDVKKKKEKTQEEAQDEALTRSGKTGLLGGLRRQVATTGRAVLTLGNTFGSAETKQRANEHREVSAVFKRVLRAISSETELRNTIDKLMREGKGVMGLKNNSKRKDILGLALFLKNEGLIGDYESGLNTAAFWDEETMDEVVEREIGNTADILKGLYDKDGDSEFHKYIQRQARFFAGAFGSEAVAVPADEAVDEEADATPDEDTATEDAPEAEADSADEEAAEEESAPEDADASIVI